MGRAVSIDDGLERVGELVGLEKGRWFLLGLDLVEDGRDQCLASVVSAFESSLNIFGGGLGAPSFRNQAFASHVVVTHVHRVIDGLLLQHLRPPPVDVGLDAFKHLPAVVATGK